MAIKAPRDTQFADPHLFKPCLGGLSRISRQVTITFAVLNTRQHEEEQDNHEDRREIAHVVGRCGGAGDADSDADAVSIRAASNVASAGPITSFIPFCDNDNSEEKSGEINNDVQISSSLPNIESLRIQEQELEKRDEFSISKQSLNGESNNSDKTTESRSPSGILGDLEMVASQSNFPR